MIGVKFGGYHSWDDFSLILSQKEIGVPAIKTSLIDIPGADGSLDITEYFGDVKYSNRKLSFTFATIVPKAEFIDLFSEIQNKIHGKRLNIVLDSDPGFFYVGRISVNRWTANKNIGEITIEADCEPYKYKLYKTERIIAVSETVTSVLTNLRKKVVPTFTTSAAVQISFNGNTYALSGAGTFTVPGIILAEGNNTISFTGTANVTVEYQEGGL